MWFGISDQGGDIVRCEERIREDLGWGEAGVAGCVNGSSSVISDVVLTGVNQWILHRA